MFVLRSLFWLSTVVLLLPASPDGKEPPPRVSLIHTAYAARTLMQDFAGICERNSDACAAGRQALVLLTRKLETGAEIVTAGIAATQGQPDKAVNHGTLTSADLAPAWSIAEATPAQ